MHFERQNRIEYHIFFLSNPPVLLFVRLKTLLYDSPKKWYIKLQWQWQQQQPCNWKDHIRSTLTSTGTARIEVTSEIISFGTVIVVRACFSLYRIFLVLWQKCLMFFWHTLNVVESACISRLCHKHSTLTRYGPVLTLQSDRVRCKLWVSWSWTKSKQRTSVKVFVGNTTHSKTQALAQTMQTKRTNERTECTEAKQKQSRTKRIKAKERDTQHSYPKTNNQKMLFNAINKSCTKSQNETQDVRE